MVVTSVTGYGAAQGSLLLLMAKLYCESEEGMVVLFEVESPFGSLVSLNSNFTSV